MLAGAALGTFLISAAWTWLQSPRYQAMAVVVPVAGQRSTLSLPGVASFLGSSFAPGPASFEATQDVVAYLLRSGPVLMAVAERRVGDQTVGEALTDFPVTPANQDRILRELRRKLRVTQARETGFVTVAVELRDSAVARAIVAEALAETGRVFREVAQAQATELLRAQDRRLDSANSTLRQTENRLLDFDLRNRVIPDRSRLSQERGRLVRQLDEATQVQQLVQADRQSAIARQLEQSPAIAVVEGLPPVIPPRAKRILFRATVLSLAVGATLAVGWLLVDLVRGFQP